MENIFPGFKEELDNLQDTYNVDNTDNMLDSSTPPILTIINLVSGFMIAIGIIALIVGVVLAIYLKSKANKEKSKML